MRKRTVALALIALLLVLVVLPTLAFATSEGDRMDDALAATGPVEVEGEVSPEAGTGSHTVTFVTRDGTTFETQIVETGDKASDPGGPWRDGCTFDNWNLFEPSDLDYYGATYASDDGYDGHPGGRFNFDTPITEDLTLYAVYQTFTTVMPYNLTNGNEHEGGLIDCDSITIDFQSVTEVWFYLYEGTNVTLKARPDSGYVFRGWSTSTSLDDVISTSTTYSTTVTPRLTVYALFEEAPLCHLCTGITDGGSFKVTMASGVNKTYTGPSNRTMHEGDEVTLTAIPASGYRFVGWYEGVIATEGTYKGFVTSNNGTLVSSSTSYSLTMDGDVLIHAVFEKIPAPTLIPIYRMYNTKTSEHLWTKSKAEYNACGTGNYRDWRQENIAWYSPNLPTPASYAASTQGNYVYVYRLYDKGRTGDHIYLTYGSEMKSYLANGWVVDKGAGFWTLRKGATISGKTTIPIYRAYNPKLKRGKHHYTPSKNEYDTICKKHGWKPEGVKFYVVKK